VNYRRAALKKYNEFPFLKHPLWVSVIKGKLSLKQVLNAETQHYLRTKAGQGLRKRSALNGGATTQRILKAALKTYIEEVVPDKKGPSHLDLIERLLVTGGVAKAVLKKTKLTPGNAAAIAMYRDIAIRGSGCHLVGAGAVEYYYCQLTPEIYGAYTKRYGMTDAQAETYRIHGTMDKEHGERALAVLDDAIRVFGWPVVENSIRDAFIATSLHYDGMLQAATRKNEFWGGSK
jgi:pyrroloquinoline quinone (PQQ) biosynthesis protein C